MTSTVFEEFINFVDLWIAALKRCIKSRNVLYIFSNNVRSQGTGRLHFWLRSVWWTRAQRPVHIQQTHSVFNSEPPILTSHQHIDICVMLIVYDFW